MTVKMPRNSSARASRRCGHGLPNRCSALYCCRFWLSSVVRSCYLGFSLLLSFCVGAHAESAKVLKVLPLFLDQKGRESISPSLFDRDAYQVLLRDKPEA